MDLVLNIYDQWLFTPYVYPKEGWPEDSLLRQIISLIILVNVHGVLLYLVLGTFSYFFLFDKKQMEHPLFLKVSLIDEEHSLCLYKTKISSSL